MLDEPKKRMGKLPCGCEIDMDAEGTIYAYIQNDLGLRIMQCKKCKLVVGIRLEAESKPRILSPFGKVAIG